MFLMSGTVNFGLNQDQTGDTTSYSNYILFYEHDELQVEHIIGPSVKK